MARKKVCKMRRSGDIDCRVDARVLYKESDCLVDGVWNNKYFMYKVFGDCWMYDLTIPHKVNPDFAYLCLIINTVKDALRLKEKIGF